MRMATRVADWFLDRTSGEPMRARPKQGLGSWPVIVLGVIVSGIGLWRVGATDPCPRFHLATQLAGSDARLQSWLGACPENEVADIDAARATLIWDVLLIAGYVLALSAVVRRWWPLQHARGMAPLTNLAIAAPFVAGGLDLAENALTAIGLRTDGTRFTYPDHLWLPVTVATVAWLKWLTFGAAVAAAVVAIGLAVARYGERSLPVQQRGEPLEPEPEPPDELGVCCSGGGIRAAAFAIGALESLESRNVLQRARWLAAVSGGAYAATAWRLVKASAPEAPAATSIIDWLRSPIPRSSAGQHRFLRNGPGGLGRPVRAALGYIAFNVAMLGALVLALAWPIGRLLGSHAVHPALRQGDRLPHELEMPAELWLPGLLVAALAGVVLMVSATNSWKVANLWKVAAALAAVALVLEAFLVALPVAMVTAGRWLSGGTAGLRASAVGTSAFAGVVLSVWHMVRKPIVGRVTRQLPRLGGVLLALVGFIWAGKVATDAAVGAGTFRAIGWPIGAGLGFLAVYSFVGVTRLSIHRIYRRRLRRTFGLWRDPATGELEAPDDPEQITWSELPADPELVICCAQQRSGIALGGLPAESFTISPNEVRLGDVIVPTDLYLEHLDGDLEVERSVASWMATSGAAFASAMGRFNMGSTNSLLAALNIDLGIWLPNPRLIADPDVRFKRVRFGYTMKEIFGWYAEGDRYVFVADGGHWENLGLVELLRRRCRTILCIDASGDEVGAYTTLRQAVELAYLELPEIVAAVDLESLDSIRPVDGALPAGLVATLEVTYKGPGATTYTGTIHYAKAQLASSLDVALRRFAKADRLFPNYSTGNQFLSNEQFANLVELGRVAGTHLADLS
jgi:hypothetical protein